MANILVTGADGFIGTALCAALSGEGLVRGAVWHKPPAGDNPSAVDTVPVGSIGPDTQWGEALSGIDIVIHLAARVHVMKDTSHAPLSDFRAVNVAGTENLARQAAAAGVRRFVFMSTIGVQGNNSGDRACLESDIPRPHNLYSQSKYEAEQRLSCVSAETGMECVVLRAPLVYGPGNPGNFLSLLRVVAKGFPLPLASLRNRKSFIYIGNLVNALILCSKHSSAAGKTFLVRDGDDVSTPELIRRVAAALGRPARLFMFPPGLLRLAGGSIGKRTLMDSLINALAVDDGKIRKELGWSPPFTMSEGLQKTAAWYNKK